jgi:hypothetical protein
MPESVWITVTCKLLFETRGNNMYTGDKKSIKTPDWSESLCSPQSWNAVAYNDNEFRQ